MLGSIFSWFRKPKRAIFKYHNGQKWTWADPLEVARSLDSHAEFRPHVHVAMMTVPADDPAAPSPQEVAEAQRVTVAAVREAFQIPAFVDGGLPEKECLELLNRFAEYLAGLKKN